MKSCNLEPSHAQLTGEFGLLWKCNAMLICGLVLAHWLGIPLKMQGLSLTEQDSAQFYHMTHKSVQLKMYHLKVKLRK